MKKKILFILLAIFLFLPISAKANTIYDIDMSIYVDKNGDAIVTEKWEVNLTEGTEGYKPYYNLGNATISDFNVTLNGQNYTYVNSWNVNGNFQDKAYKNGINYINNGLELCWGISQYGYNEYTLIYKINGFVSQTEDAQMIYWTLIPYELSSKPKNVHIKIYSDEKYSDDLPVWGYGNYGGTAYVYDGYIEMNSEGTLDSNEYMTILVNFPLNTFNTKNILNHNFDYYYQMAEEGATKYKKDSSSWFHNIIGIFMTMTTFLVYFIVGIVIYKSIIKSYNKLGGYNLEFKPTGKTIPKDIPNIREVPFNNDIYEAYWVASAYNLSKNKSDFLGAILLKWLKENKISIKKEMTGIFNNKEQTVIDMTKEFTSDNSLEIELFSMMKTASKDGFLESKEFEKWCKKNYSKIYKWFDDILDYKTEMLINENKIIEEEHTSMKIFKSSIYRVQPIMLEEAKMLKGLKNFLVEFSRINDREAIEVNLWEYYLIYAQILGIADKVAKQFKKLYPELIENYSYDYDDIIFIHTISYTGMEAASTSKSRAESYSSGGGGFSSGGGGGGSFGGGGGGGGFR